MSGYGHYAGSEAVTYKSPGYDRAFQPPSGYEKQADGCCHKTVLERCSDCAYPAMA